MKNGVQTPEIRVKYWLYSADVSYNFSKTDAAVSVCLTMQWEAAESTSEKTLSTDIDFSVWQITKCESTEIVVLFWELFLSIEKGGNI